MKLNRKNKKGFTIVELVIVIAVIGILSAVLIPTFVNLSNQAQETAKKQQVADAYTAYLVEATDNKYDEYLKYDGTSTYSDIAIAHKAQAGVVMMLKDEWFTYTAEKGWEKGTGTVTSDKALVVNAFTANPQALCNLKKEVLKTVGVNDVTADGLNTELSTFNGVTVYYKTAA